MPMIGWSARRWVVAMTALAAALLVTVGGQGGAATAAQTAEQEGPWTFTDDRGVEVTLPSRPRRIVAYDQAASALWHLGITPVGIFGGPLTADNPSLVGVDLSGIESVGEIYGEINLERLAALRPDLIVTAFDPRQSGPVFGFTEDGVEEKVEAIAPIVALDGVKDPIEVIERFEELAHALGADLEAPELTGARQRFDEALEELRAAVAAKPGLRAVALGAYPAEGVYFARPAQFPGLRQLGQAGLALVSPQGDPEDINEDFAMFFWDVVSLEQADKYPADLILIDSRIGTAGIDALAEVATWRTLPAVQAGQIVEWRALENWSYAAYTHDFELLAEAVNGANPDLVP